MRNLSEIANEIIKITEANSKRPNYVIYARPYLCGLLSCNTISDKYGEDSASTLIIYALSNLAPWRGEDAKKLKAELKSHLTK